QPGVLPREVGGADQTGVVAQRGANNPSLRTETPAGERAPERFSGRPQEQVTGIGDPTADHERAGIERRGDVRQPYPEPASDLLEQLLRDRVAVLGRGGDDRSGNAARVAVDAVEQMLRNRRTGRGELPCLTAERVAAGVLLPAAPVAALAAVPSGHDRHVTELPRHAVLPALEDAVDHDRAAD